MALNMCKIKIYNNTTKGEKAINIDKMFKLSNTVWKVKKY